MPQIYLSLISSLSVIPAKIHFVEMRHKPIDYIGFFGTLKGAYGVSRKIALSDFRASKNEKPRCKVRF